MGLKLMEAAGQRKRGGGVRGKLKIINSSKIPHIPSITLVGLKVADEQDENEIWLLGQSCFLESSYTCRKRFIYKDSR